MASENGCNERHGTNGVTKIDADELPTKMEINSRKYSYIRFFGWWYCLLFLFNVLLRFLDACQD
jgi:hypothetical protein